MHKKSYSETDALFHDNETIPTTISNNFPGSKIDLSFDGRFIIKGESAKKFNQLYKKVENLITVHDNKDQSINHNLFSLFNTVKSSLTMLIGFFLPVQVLGRPEPRGQNFLKKIMESDSNNWPQYYGHINETLYELEAEIKQGILSYAIKDKIFWFFRNYLDDHEKNITSEQNKKLFNIIKKTLEQQDSELLLLEENHLSILEDIFMILRKIYSSPDEGIKILNIYIKKAAEDSSLSKTKNADKFLVQLFNTFKVYLPSIMDNDLSLIEPLKNLINIHLIWNEKYPVAMLIKALSFLKDMREQYITNKDVTQSIDQYVKTICERAIVEIPNAYRLPYLQTWIKEDIGSAYVKYLPSSERIFFDGLYKIPTINDVLPCTATQFWQGEKGVPDFEVTIRYHNLSLEKKEQAFQLAKKAYLDIESFKSKYNLVSVQKQPVNITINIFDDKYHFERYKRVVFNHHGSAEGICIASKNLCQPSVYQTLTEFMHFNHEFTHAYMHHIFGENYIRFVPRVFSEGIADFFDKESLNSDKMNWLAATVALKELPEVVTLHKEGIIVYHWGYFWFKYMFEKDNISDVRKIFSTIQKSDKKIIKSTITAYANNKKESFNEWLENLKDTYIPQSVDINQAQEEYLQFLENNSDFASLIKKNNGQLRFEFMDNYAYTLETEKISCTYIYRDSDNRISSEISYPMYYAFYKQFKEKLLNNVLGLSTNNDSLSSINVQEDEIYSKGILSFVSNQEMDPRKRELLETIIQHSPQKMYLQDLNSNPELRNFLLENTIKFEFANTFFILNDQGIRRYSNSRLETEQSINVSDYKWLKSALEIFILKKQLENSSIDINLISKLLHTNEHYVNDRDLKNMQPKMDNNLQILIHKFVLHSPSGLSHEFQNLFGQKNINIYTLQQIIREQEGESSANPSNRFSTKSNPLVMTSKDVYTLQQIIREQEGESSAKPTSNSFLSTINPLVITTTGVNVTNLLLNVTGTNKPVLTNDNSQDTHDSNNSNWITPVVIFLAVSTSFMAGFSFWLWKKSKTSNKKKDAMSNCKTLTIPLMFQESPISAQKEKNIPDVKCSADRQFRV